MRRAERALLLFALFAAGSALAAEQCDMVSYDKETTLRGKAQLMGREQPGGGPMLAVVRLQVERPISMQGTKLECVTRVYLEDASALQKRLWPGNTYPSPVEVTVTGTLSPPNPDQPRSPIMKVRTLEKKS